MSTDSTQGPSSIQNIGKYRVLGTLGRGSMGVVYKAQDPEIGRIVAIKTLRKVVATPGNSALQLLERFKIEARSAGNLRHPNIITIFEANSYDNTPYLVMDYIQGDTLDALIQSGGRLEPSVMLRYLAQAAKGIDHAHAQGVLHRDIKPANILVDKAQNVFILDFGVARIVNDTAYSGGPVLGTPGYMAPEQILNQELDYRTDIFALGIVAFECLTGKRPFAGEGFSEVIGNILNGKRSSLIDLLPGAPLQADLVFQSVLATDKTKRYNTAEEFVRALSEAWGRDVTGTPDAPNNLPATRSRKVSDWRPFFGKKPVESQTSTQSADTPRPRKRTLSSEFLSPWRSSSRAPAIVKAPGVSIRREREPDRPSSIFNSNDVFFGSVRHKQSNKTRFATFALAGICILLSLLIFLILFSSNPQGSVENVGGGEIALTSPPETTHVPDLVALRPDEVSAVPEGKDIHAMKDAEILGVLVSPASSYEQVIQALREGLLRKMSKFVEASLYPLQSDSYLVRVEAIKVLTEYGDLRVVPHVLTLLDDHDPLVRREAAKGIGILGDRRAIGYLSNRLIKEDAPEVKTEIRQALSRLNGYVVKPR